MAELSGRVAIVTGGSRGIGLAVATLFHENGASLILVGRDRERLAQAQRLLRTTGGASVEIVSGDIADSSTARQAVECASASFGRLDAVANVAGVFPTALLDKTTDAMFDDTIRANLTGTFHFCRAALPLLREHRGAIVNMSSTAARFPTPGLSVYSAAKAAIEGFTRSIAVEAAPHVRVNAVSAGPTLTETAEALVRSDTTGAVRAVVEMLPLQRMAAPREIAEAVLFLASDRASFITGQVLHANGGGVMA